MKRIISGIALLLLWGCSWMLYVYAGGFVPAFMVYSLGALLAGSALVPLICVRGVEVERFIEHPICLSGESVPIKVRVRFWSALPVPWLLIRERWTYQHGLPSEVESSRLFFPWGAREISFTYTFGPLPRGRHEVKPVELQSGDLFGFVSFRRVVMSGQQLLVYPKPAVAGIRAGGRIVPFDQLPSGRVLGSQDVFGAGIRSYSPGDPLRSIHWKSSAKRGELLAYERESAISRKITVILDTVLRGAASMCFEAALEAAAGLWLQAKRVDEAAGFLVCGAGERIQPFAAPGVRGVPHNVFRQLAELASGDGYTGDRARLAGDGHTDEYTDGYTGDGLRLGAAYAGQGSRVIVVTPRLDKQTAAAVRRIDGRRQSISVVAMSYGQLTEEERLLKQLLDASGIDVTLVPVPIIGEVKPYAYANDAGA